MRQSQEAGAAIAAWFRQHRLPLKLSLRITAAGLASYAVAELLGLAHGYWAVLTAVLVMQASLGGSLKAMIDRLIGTIGGAACGIIVAAIVPQTGPVTVGLALALALIPLSVLVAFRPAYRVAPVTAVIVVLVSPGAETAFASGLARTFEIGLGTLIAFVVALVVLPSRAHLVLRDASREALAGITDQGRLLLGDLGRTPEPNRVLALHERIRGAIERAAEIAREAGHERASRITDAPDPEPLVRALRRVSHDLVMLARFRTVELPPAICARLAPCAAAIANGTADFLASATATLASGGGVPGAAGVIEAIERYDAAMTAIRREGLTRDLSDESAEQVFGLAFAIEQLCRNLGELADRLKEYVRIA